MNTNTSSQKTYRLLFWLLLAAATLFRLGMAGRFGLGTDESHYLIFSRHPAWGYFDHPPMVAFLVALTTLFGKGLSFVRLGPILCSSASLVLLRFLALALYGDEKVSLWALVLMLAMPYQHLLSVALLPDATQNLFWCGTLLAVWYALKSGKWVLWLLAGILFGGALLSKYHAILLPLCLFGYLLFSSDRRFWLRRVQPYVTIAIGFALFLPNIIWNADHDWISYAFQLRHGDKGHFSIAKFLGVFGGQLGVWSPIIFVLLILAWIGIARKRPSGESDRFVLWTSLPVFVFFMGIGTFGKMLPHWPSVGWWTGSLAVATMALKKIALPGKKGIRWRRWCLAGAATGFLMTCLLYLILLFPIIRPFYNGARSLSLDLHRHFPFVKPLRAYRAKNNMSDALFGWKRIAAGVEKIRAEMPIPGKTFVFAHKFYTTSQLAVYLKRDTISTTLRNEFDQYHLWFSPPAYSGWDALLVDDNRWSVSPGRYLALFKGIDPNPVVINVFRDGDLAHSMKIYKCYGFRGRFAK
jgi:Dolichyl-phosphate-mannose-protein mannosyltransferase